MNSKRQPNHFASVSGDERKNYSAKKCTKCGQMWHENNQICPAKGKQCSKCHKLDHFANVCRTDFQVTITKTVIKKEQSTVKYQNRSRHCNKCGRNSHGYDEVCPAKGKHCLKCNKPNHFANVCRANIDSQAFETPVPKSSNDGNRDEYEDEKNLLKGALLGGLAAIGIGGLIALGVSESKKKNGQKN